MISTRFNILCTQGLETSKDASDLLKKRISPERVEILSSGKHCYLVHGGFKNGPTALAGNISQWILLRH